MEMPEIHKEIVGTKQQMGGGLFSAKKGLDYEDYNVLAWRWGSAKIVDMKTMKMMHPTIEYLVKKEGMKRSMWTRPFPVPEIQLKNED
jgi:hypothetical protein